MKKGARARPRNFPRKNWVQSIDGFLLAAVYIYYKASFPLYVYAHSIEKGSRKNIYINYMACTYPPNTAAATKPRNLHKKKKNNHFVRRFCTTCILCIPRQKD